METSFCCFVFINVETNPNFSLANILVKTIWNTFQVNPAIPIFVPSLTFFSFLFSFVAANFVAHGFFLQTLQPKPHIDFVVVIIFKTNSNIISKFKMHSGTHFHKSKSLKKNV